MDDIKTDIAQCNSCGAPLSGKPNINHPIHCVYCDLTNYLKLPNKFSPETSSYMDDLESERHLEIYQESQKILENFPGELIGEEVGKLRIKMQVGPYAFPLLLVLDDLPERPYIDGPNKMREVLACDISELDSMRNWSPGSSSILDVLEEIYRISEESLPKIMESSTKPVVPKISSSERDPFVQQILDNYDASATKKVLVVKFYAQTGDVIQFTIKRKKNFPIGLENEILSRYPLIRGPLEDYAKGRIDLLTTLAEIERLLYI
ncbi:MAG: hypothetical protein KAT16_00690 [Candidatus Heimdallarchaeota archaeon]|nr:hypothetical protein [Candidatus Heimdallarchaeota archaeon]